MILREILFFVVCLCLFFVLRSHYSKGESVKTAVRSVLYVLLRFLTSPFALIAILIAVAYIVYRLMH